MNFSVEQYTQQLAALLPQGPLWEDLRQSGSNAMLLLQAFAEECARIDTRTEDLIDETDPRTFYELLSGWEQYLGLPDKCVGLGVTLEQRREAVLATLTNAGGQSRQHFIDVATRLGVPGSSITEYDPYTVDDAVDDPIHGTDWRFVWKLTAPTPPINQFTVDSLVDESLGEQAPTTRLECVINANKPAHTIALFEYV